MEQHPVPQHIAAYEFHLVGDMTLKQFGFLAGGIIIALIIYGSPLPGYFKWPGVVFSGFFGFALAFIPIQERPLNQWIVSFMKAVFSPTQYIWRKKAQELELLKEVSRKALMKKSPVAPPDEVQLAEYLKSLPPREKTPAEEKEKGYLQQITSLFQSAQAPTIVYEQPTYESPAPKKPPEVAKTVKPQAKPGKKSRPAIVLPEEPSQPKKRTVTAKTTTHLPIPTPPTQPNLLVGMVLNKNGELIEGVLLEIKNSQGVSVRALKTNKLGQFRTAYPLENDTYEIDIEKENYQFDTIKIELKGEIIQPIEIRAK